MFKLIGFIVVLAVLVIGYPYINDWYLGKSTPKETVVNIREQLGKDITPSGNTTSNQVSNKTSAESSAGKAKPEEETGPMDTEKAARELLKHAND